MQSTRLAVGEEMSAAEATPGTVEFAQHLAEVDTEEQGNLLHKSQPWCQDNPEQWSEKCKWNGCADASECSALCAATTDTSKCVYAACHSDSECSQPGVPAWCLTNPNDWHTKCQWTACSASSECSGDPHRQHFCHTNTEGWDVKCTWTGCTGWPECASDPAPAPVLENPDVDPDPAPPEPVPGPEPVVDLDAVPAPNPPVQLPACTDNLGSISNRCRIMCKFGTTNDPDDSALTDSQGKTCLEKCNDCFGSTNPNSGDTGNLCGMQDPLGCMSADINGFSGWFGDAICGLWGHGTSGCLSHISGCYNNQCKGGDNTEWTSVLDCVATALPEPCDAR